MRRSLAPIAALAAAALALPATGAGLAGPPPNAPLGIPAIPIPSTPGPDPGPAFLGAPAEPRPVPSFAVPQHPFMAANGTSNIHNDAYMTDSYVWRGPLGSDLVVTSTWLGLEECASITFDTRGRIVALCGTLDGARLRLLDPATLATLAVLPLPPRLVRPGTTPLTDLCSAGYFYLDERDRGVVSTNLNQVWVVSVRLGALLPERVHDLNAHVRAPDCLVSVLPDWSGRLWFVSRAAVVGTIDPVSGATASTTLAGEGVFNSFAVDEEGGVYIVTDHALYRFDADPETGAPRETWRVAYDRGTRSKPGMLSWGSGTTPTLLEPDLVAIADNAEPRIRVEVYRRATGERVCGVPVFSSGASATENSLIAVGSSLVVENNFGYTGPASVDRGATTAPGVARVDVDATAGSCAVGWTSQEIAPSTVPKASLATGLVYLYTKPPRADGVDAWYFTAIDFHTGETAYRRLAGTGYLYNNHYAPVSIGPDGAAYVGALGGLIRIVDR